MVNIFEGLSPIQGDGSQLDKELAQLISSLMATDNIELKSEIANPLNLTRLNIVGAWSKQQGMPGVAQVINRFVEDYLKFMVSHNRQGRLEVVKAISEFKSQIKKTLLGPKEVSE